LLDLMFITPSATITLATVTTVAIAGPPAAAQMSKFETSGVRPAVSRMSRLKMRLPAHGESAGVLPKYVSPKWKRTSYVPFATGIA
jgi:hypothetical protein